MRYADDPPMDAGLVALVTEAPVDIDAPLAEGGTLGDVLGLAVRAVGSSRIEREEARAIIGAALDGLRVRERAILTLLHGLDGGRPLGLRAVAPVLHVTYQRIGQVSQRAEARLREAVRSALAPRGRR